MNKINHIYGYHFADSVNSMTLNWIGKFIEAVNDCG